MVFGDNTTKIDPRDQGAVNEHLLNLVDEVRREVFAIHAQVDTEIKQIEKMVHAIHHQLQETDGQVDRLERLEPTIRNIEKSVRNIENRLPRR